ncbi:hypothetical protein [Streptomyces mirabilis]|uniref:hypothetical protein n=1 Tax=Streptomyces mirabilis TaxID=68239 RepID=UPI0034090F0C
MYGCVEEFRTTARFLKDMAARPYATAGSDRWTVVFADLGHDLIVLGTLPTPDEQTDVSEDLLRFLFYECLSSYTVVAADTAAAEGIARSHFKAERADIEPWADTGLLVIPGTEIPPRH